MARTTVDTLTYVESNAPVETQADTLAVVKSLPNRDTLNEVKARQLVHTKAGTPDEMRHYAISRPMQW